MCQTQRQITLRKKKINLKEGRTMEIQIGAERPFRESKRVELWSGVVVNFLILEGEDEKVLITPEGSTKCLLNWKVIDLTSPPAVGPGAHILTIGTLSLTIFIRK